MYKPDWFGTRFETIRDNDVNWLAFACPTPAILCYRVHGHITLKLAQEIMRSSLQRLGASRVHVMHDWWNVTGYDTEARLQLTQFVGQHQASFGETHLLLRSPLVVIGVSTANLVLRHRMRAHKEQSDFLVAYDALVKADAAAAAHA